MKITLKDGSVLEVENGKTAGEIAKSISEGLFRNAVCARVDGELVDLSRAIDRDCALEIVTLKEKDGLNVFRHTASHVLAQAVKAVFPTCKLAIGPVIENGFYYDIDFKTPINKDDLGKIEAEMNRIIKSDLPIERFTLSRRDALRMMDNFGEPYKKELINDLPKDAEISFYKQGDFVDLCRGPHMPSTGRIKAFRLTSITGAYWRGDEKNKMLTRIYGTAFEKKSELEEYLDKVEEAKKALKAIIDKFNVEVISIGNGTASKESEIFVAETLKEIDKKVSYIVVSEAGASVYSASKLGAEEFPDYDVAERSAVSIARRLQDPLAELIKIDPKSIGVGQYQHDMPQARLDSVLEGVLEDCVNSVGVDLNTASTSLLKYVAGLNAATAKNIDKYRDENGRFRSRKEILKVSKLGEKAFEQCAGFLRITDGDNILDNTAVHPESYESAEKLLSLFGYTDEDVRAGKIKDLRNKIKAKGENAVAEACGIGVPTMKDIVSELLKPGRDIRDALPKPVLREDIMSIDDLKVGMVLTGTVRNVADFGVFVDLGVHQDGLVHISEITDKFIRHPSDVLKVGEVVKVRVIGVDKKRNRIALSMKSPAADKKAKNA